MHFKEAINFKLIVFLFEHKMSYFQQTDNKTYTKIYNNTEWNGKEQQQQTNKDQTNVLCSSITFFLLSFTSTTLCIILYVYVIQFCVYVESICFLLNLQQFSNDY